MSGPIVRTGTTPKFWENWDKAFGGGDSTAEKSDKKKSDAKAGKKKSAKKKKSKK